MANAPSSIITKTELIRLPKGIGILAYQDIKGLIAHGYITASAPINEQQLQPASLDLRLGGRAYKVDASFLPGRSRVTTKLASCAPIDLSGGAILRTRDVYVIPVMEQFKTPLPTQVRAKANPKSTVGRLDVFTRLITDYGDQFDYVPNRYRGELYLEVSPRSFDVLVHEGTPLSQLRFFRGNAVIPDKRLEAIHEEYPLACMADGTRAEIRTSEGLWVSVDLRGSGSMDIVGYKAAQVDQVIDLDQIGRYDPREFWQIIERPTKPEVRLEPNAFYILASKERLRVPSNLAAEMVSFDPSMGEFRVHYAGFFDPGFGYGAGDIMGTRAVLEVRSHQVPFMLEDGQYIARLRYETMLCRPDKIYGPAAGSSYEHQGLRLGKQFRSDSMGVRQPPLFT